MDFFLIFSLSFAHSALFNFSLIFGYCLLCQSMYMYMYDCSWCLGTTIDGSSVSAVGVKVHWICMDERPDQHNWTVSGRLLSPKCLIEESSMRQCRGCRHWRLHYADYSFIMWKLAQWRAAVAFAVIYSKAVNCARIWRGDEKLSELWLRTTLIWIDCFGR